MDLKSKMMENNIKAQIWILKWMDDNPDHTKEEGLIALKKAEQMTKTQTAIEYIVNVVNSCIAPDYIPNEIVMQSKQMEEDQIIASWENGFWEGCKEELSGNSGLQYYNETYGPQVDKK